MAGLTLAQAETQLAAWIEADAAVANNQSYSIGSRSLTRADAGEITDKIRFWQSQVNKLSAKASSRGRVSHVVPQ